ncbi:MAG: hypothetical protein ABI658_10015 [Acidimicrobiales bacterium]
MAFRRRRDRVVAARVSVAPPPPHTNTEDLVFGLLRQTQHLNDRLSRLEERFEANLKASLSQADSNDLIELRLHSARLAAELSRVTVELRAEIDDLARSRTVAERISRLAERNPEPSAEDATPPAAAPVHTDVINLTERRARQSTGWQPITDD